MVRVSQPLFTDLLYGDCRQNDAKGNVILIWLSDQCKKFGLKRRLKRYEGVLPATVLWTRNITHMYVSEHRVLCMPRRSVRDGLSVPE